MSPSVRLMFVIAVAGGLAVAACRGVASAPRQDDLAALAAATGSALPFEARLSGGFAPSAHGAPRSAEPLPPIALSPDARIAIALLEKRLASDATPEALAAVGVAYLVQGDVDRSVAALEEAAGERERARVWNDLGAAYLAKAERVPARRVEYYARALDASVRSIRIAPSDEARFNRALALEGLAPFVGSTLPWTEYLARERDPRWLAVAQRHVAGTKRRPDARDRWTERKADLRAALERRDRSGVDGIVHEFPEASIEFFDQELLVEWADGRQASLDDARRLAGAIESVTHDRMPADAVAAIDRAGRLLVEAHRDYAEGLWRFDADDFAGADKAFARARAGFARGKSPYAAWAEVGQVTVLYVQRRLESADDALASIEQRVRPRRYPTILGRLLWLRGVVNLKRWRLAIALDAFRESVSRFETSQEHEYAVSVYGQLADTLRTLGDHRESWEFIGRTLEGLGTVRRPIRRYVFLYDASLFASSQSLLDAALVFQNAALEEARRIGIGPTIEALTQRAAIQVRAHDDAAAVRDLETARALIGGEPDGARKQWAEAERRMVVASTRAAGAEARLDDLESALKFFATAEPSTIPRLRLDIGRAHVARGELAAASDAFALGIEELELQQTRLHDDAYKVSYFDEMWNLFPEMIALQLDRLRDDVSAFAYAERSRARALLASTPDAQPRRLSDIRAALPASAVMVYYVTLSDRLVVWTVTRSAARRVDSPIGRAALATLVNAHRSVLQQQRDDRIAAERLYDLVLRQALDGVALGATLVLVPDGDLQRLPFATLRDRANGQYLIERHPLVMAPSASLFVIGAERWRRVSARPTSAMLVGDPSRALTAAPGAAAPLPGAQAEVSQAAAFYADRIVLTGRAATKSGFLRDAPKYDVVHFGGHSFANAEYPPLSRLVFGSQSANAEDPLFAYEIAQLAFSKTRVVVLAACSTAAGSVSRGEGVMSIARPFLAAGVPAVVASQWDVEDRPTEALFVAFHRALAQSGDPLEALRTAQLSLLHGGDSVLASPENWGAFLVLGASVR